MHKTELLQENLYFLPVAGHVEKMRVFYDVECIRCAKEFTSYSVIDSKDCLYDK